MTTTAEPPPAQDETLQNPLGNRRTGRKRLPVTLTKEQVDHLAQHALSARARLLIRILWRAGLRISEAMALEYRDFDYEARPPVLKVRNAKGGTERLVTLHPELGTAVADYREHAGRTRRARVRNLPDGPIFPGEKGRPNLGRDAGDRWIRQAVNNCKAVGLIPGDLHVVTHSLRHSAARYWYENGIQLNVVQNLLGHRQLSTTIATYLPLRPDPTGALLEIP